MQIPHAHLLALLLFVSCSSAAPPNPRLKSPPSGTPSTSVKTPPSQLPTQQSTSTGLSTQLPTSTPHSTTVPSTTAPGSSTTSTGRPRNNSTVPPQETGRVNQTCPLPAQGTRGKASLTKRAPGPVNHPRGTQADIRLFHGTASQQAADDIPQGIRLSPKPGDFNPAINTLGSEGGFYLTDSFASAAQFACFGGDLLETRTIPHSVHVLEFTWAAGVAVHEFTRQAASEEERINFIRFNGGINPSFQDTAAQIVQTSDMITGAMNVPGVDEDLTPEFQQYAIIKESALSRLHYVRTHSDILCANIARGASLSAEKYTAGQGNNQQAFARLVTRYQDPNNPRTDRDCVSM